MTSIATRAVCAVLSMLGAAGLVASVDPANVVGSRHLAAPTIAVVDTHAGATARG